MDSIFFAEIEKSQLQAGRLFIRAIYEAKLKTLEFGPIVMEKPKLDA